MPLKLLLLFYLLCFSLSDTFDYIENDKKTTITGNYGYIDISEFGGYYNLYIVATVKGGSFYDSRHLHIAGGSEKPVDPSKYSFVTSYYFKKEDHEIINKQYKFQTLDYNIPINSDFEYCYFEFPKRTSGSLEVTITTSGFPKVLVWVLPVVFVIIIIVIIFVVRHLKRKKAQVYNRQQFQAAPQPVQRPPAYATTVTTTYIPPPQPVYPPQTVY